MMKRFMSWLLRQIQRLFGALPKRRSDHVSSTELGSKIASRLQQSKEPDEAAPTVIRDWRSDRLNPPNQQDSAQNSDQSDRLTVGESNTLSTAIQSATPLHQKSSSASDDVVDSVVKEPDTHHRLDAAAAAKEGSPTVTPSFPTEVSDLISAASTLKVDISANTLDNTQSSPTQSLSVPDVGSTHGVDAKNEQLPEIHDLLPAIEPDEQSEGSVINAAPSLEKPDTQETEVSGHSSAQLQDNLTTAELVEEAIPTATRGSVDIPVNEGRKTASNQLTQVEKTNEIVISTENSVETAVDETPRSSIVEPKVESTDGDVAEEVTLFSFDIVEQAVTEQEVVEQAVADVSTQSLLSDGEVSNGEEDKALNLKESTSTPDERTQFNQQQTEEAPLEVSNPWLEAQQSIPTQSSLEKESKPALFEKSGTVKLLFKLKPGNFHGYIAPEDGSRDILFHQKYINADIFDDLERGAHVIATAKQVAGKIYATHVALLKE